MSDAVAVVGAGANAELIDEKKHASSSHHSHSHAHVHPQPIDIKPTLAAALLVQRRIFQLQAEKFCQLAAAVASSTTASDVSPTTSSSAAVTDRKRLAVPDVIKIRAQHDVPRFVDDIEIVLMGILNCDGIIALTCQVEELLVIMTRITKVEHRVLCLHIICNAITTECGASFVTNGGLRLLKRWIKIAEEENCIDELTLILTALMKLPFNEKVIKDTEIGKAIKKLLKFKGSEGTSATKINRMHKEVKALMDLWTSQVQSKQSDSNVPSSPRMKENIYADIDKETFGFMSGISHFVKHVEQQQQQQQQQQQATAPTSSINKEPLSPTAAKLARGNADHSSSIASALKSSNPIIKAEAKKPAATFDPKPVLPVNSLAAKLALAQQQMASNAAANAATATATTPVVKAPRLREKKLENKSSKLENTPSVDLTSSMSMPYDFTRNASKNDDPFDLSSNDATYDPFNAIAALNSSSSGSSTNSIGFAVAAAPMPALRSALKRKAQDISTDNTDSIATNSNNSSGGNNKRKVKWVDQENAGSLKQVFTFEVDKIKNSVASYKNHKDLAKKEKQIEKDIISHKRSDAMQPTGEWVRPSKLVLSMEIQESAPGPLVSPENDAQCKRIAHVLEARYVDDTLIPTDPDNAPSVFDVGDDGPPMVAIPWSSGDEPVPTDAFSVDEYDPSAAALVNSLPEALRALDPETLALIVQDASNITAILNPDRTINYTNLELLRRGQLHLYRLPIVSPVYATGSRGFYDEPGLAATHFRDQPIALPLGHTSRVHGIVPVTVPVTVPVVPHSGLPVLAPLGSAYYPPKQGGETYWDQPQPKPTFGTIPMPSAPIMPTLAPSLITFGSESVSSHAPAPKKEFKYATKAATPCRFYNTTKGCQLGDKCAFGHFREEDLDDRDSSRSRRRGRDDDDSLRRNRRG